MLSRHHVPIAQSASTLHPPIGSQVPLALQLDDRHTVEAVTLVHGPVPAAYPHRESAGSHTPLAHTSAAAALVQVPSRVGLVWAASLGIAPPLASSAVQAWAVSSHHVPPAQSASTLQPAGERQAPFALHAPERQTTLPVAAEQGPSPFA
jgi:hypothetical protein